MGIRHSLAKLSATASISNIDGFKISRINDAFIMQMVSDAQCWSQSKLMDINHCRLYLGVITLADICTADGRRIHKEAYGLSTRKFRSSLLNWPCVPEPSSVQKTTWRSFLTRQVLCRIPSRKVAKFKTRPPGIASRADMQIHTPLGRWIQHPLSRQLFDEVHSHSSTFTREGEKYKNSTNGEIVEPQAIPQPLYPWERYDGREKDTKKQIPINKSIVPYQEYAFFEPIAINPLPSCWKD